MMMVFWLRRWATLEARSGKLWSITLPVGAVKENHRPLPALTCLFATLELAV